MDTLKKPRVWRKKQETRIEISDEDLQVIKAKRPKAYEILKALRTHQDVEMVAKQTGFSKASVYYYEGWWKSVERDSNGNIVFPKIGSAGRSNKAVAFLQTINPRDYTVREARDLLASKGYGTYTTPYVSTLWKKARMKNAS